MMPGWKRGRCENCNDDNSGVVYTVNAHNLKGERKIVEVMRCRKCDAAECPSPKCDEKTLKVNARRCQACGFDLVPKPEGKA